MHTPQPQQMQQLKGQQASVDNRKIIDNDWVLAALADPQKGTGLDCLRK